VQNESDVLREELKEDKWLTVFRTVTDQADGMMSSLEKAVNRCQVSDMRSNGSPFH
jgi:Yeast cortical protein KAR9